MDTMDIQEERSRICHFLRRRQLAMGPKFDL